ncbi:MAG: inositol monophosphatase family protein [Actinomycetota bacterium]
MSGVDLDTALAAAERAARAGGEVVRAHFGRARDIRAKAPGDWVSEADLASEAAVRAVLEAALPLPVLGEEAGGAIPDTGWLVDPLDGTANFLHRFDAVGVSVGLVVDGVPTVGVVYAPLLDRCYSAATGRGARRDGAPISVSGRRLEAAIVSTGLPFRRKANFERYRRALTEVFTTFEDVRRIGAASLDLCWTAEGVFDGYFELHLGPWDVAAGAVIVREAGGVVTDWHGDPDDFLASGDILAGPPGNHEQLLAIARATA